MTSATACCADEAVEAVADQVHGGGGAKDRQRLQVLAEPLPVVRHRDDEGPREQPPPVEAVQQPSELLVGERDLADKIARHWGDEPAHRFVVCTGGGGGIMEAANRGASEAAGMSIGLNIGLPHEQRPNPYITRELSFEFRYFFMRKLWFAYLARALVVFPGGFGTLDELMEILTLQQTGKIDRETRVLLYGSAYWKEIVNFEALARHGMIAPEDLRLFEYADDPATALARLQGWLRPEPEAEGPAFASSRDASTGDASGG